MKHQTPTTGEPLLLHRGVLHRVDATQVPSAFTGAAVGSAMCTGTLCHSHPQCADQLCEGHPGNLGHADDRSTPNNFGWARMLAVSVLGWLAAAGVFVLLSAVIVLMGRPQDH